MNGAAGSGSGPNFLVVGAAKSGTTSLCHYLRQHPDVFVAREKESHFFLFEDELPTFSGPGDEDAFVSLIIQDRRRYLRCFADAGPFPARGEASVYYLYEPRALRRALEFDPGMKFVAVLRNPVERSFSAWSHMMRDGREPEHDFLHALADERRRVELGWSYGFRYESVGHYASQIEAALAVVPPGQLHVVLYEDMTENAGPVFAELFEFLGVRDFPVDNSLVMNASGRPRLRALNRLMTQRNPVKESLKKVLPYSLGNTVAQRLRNWNLQAVTMSGADRRHVQGLYDRDVERLRTLLGRDLAEWG